ncbi:MAG: O-antigen ligase family protein [Lentisphaeria bacterium]|nr:O-antigen ligase family protein [Lentisphaeria bacterium]
MLFYFFFLLFFSILILFKAGNVWQFQLGALTLFTFLFSGVLFKSDVSSKWIFKWFAGFIISVLFFIQLLPVEETPRFLISDTRLKIYENNTKFLETIDLTTQNELLSLYPAGSISLIMVLLSFWLLLGIVCLLKVEMKKKIPIALLYLNFIIITIAFVQNFIIKVPHRKVLWIYDTNSYLSFGPFVNPNHMAIFSSFFIGLSIHYLFQWKLNKLLFNLFLIVLIVFNWWIIFWCNSQGGYLLAGFITTIFPFKYLKLSLKNSIGIFSIFSIIGVYILGSKLSGKITYLIDGLSRLEGVPSRVVLWERTIPIISDFFPFGTGLGGYESVSSSYLIELNSGTLFYAHAESVYINLLATSGLLGGAFILFLFFFFISEIYDRYKEKRLNQNLLIISVGGLLVFGFHSLYDFAITTPLYSFVIAILLGLGSHYKRKGNEESPKWSGLLRWGVFLFLLSTLVIVFGAVSKVQPSSSTMSITVKEMDKKDLEKVAAQYPSYWQIPYRLAVFEEYDTRKREKLILEALNRYPSNEKLFRSAIMYYNVTQQDDKKHNLIESHAKYFKYFSYPEASLKKYNIKEEK